MRLFMSWLLLVSRETSSDELVASALTFRTTMLMATSNTAGNVYRWHWFRYGHKIWRRHMCHKRPGSGWCLAFCVGPCLCDGVVAGMSCWVVAAGAFFVVGPAASYFFCHFFTYIEGGPEGNRCESLWATFSLTRGWCVRSLFGLYGHLGGCIRGARKC